ncbi:Crp/Fnr family transcriptional regulator [Brevundimonas sp.]|uniref:Crp/Fnr family transcriptional regulator n=1 Tax=Brevundimonas sp. TaxID=1871086 RepID=UPI002CFE59CE|nr:Crp/Fnr family transcriptional regulator [Brevundimonas sp.]HWQ87309.1 Crp/Fnr family transcriptional regulator [Brevundimonas sp.]
MDWIEVEHRLKDGAWPATLTPAARAALLAAGRIRAVDDHAAVYRAADAGDGLYAVLEGEIRLIGHSAAGRRLIYLILRPGDWFGEISVLDGKPRLHDAVVFGPSAVLHVGSARLDAIAAAHPGFDRALGALACMHQRTALAFVEQALTASAEARLAFILTELAGRNGRRTDRGLEIDLRLSQEELAGMVGLSRQRLAALLGRLRREGVVATHYARLTILDPGRLQQMCGR